MEESSDEPSPLEQLDAVHQTWASLDERYVRGIAANDAGAFVRDAGRGTRDGTEVAEEREPKTIQTDEMVEELDRRTREEIVQMEQDAYEEDDDFVLDESL